VLLEPEYYFRIRLAQGQAVPGVAVRLTFMMVSTRETIRFRAKASDYDGTLARDGRVDGDILAGLERARQSGRKVILVTGRELSSLYVFSAFHLFDWIVAENSALLHNPATPEERLLCPAASSTLVVNPRKLGIPLSVGKCVVATVRPHHAAVLVSIRELNLNLHIIFNKEAVMILPRGTERVQAFPQYCLTWGFRVRAWWESAMQRTIMSS
jgi:hydroxymethylpyrimidine pyrophosphatase-like HAD family hydrolase